jgi:hypothetical protein
MAFLKLAVFGFIALTIIYWSIGLYLAAVQKDRLRAAYLAAHPQAEKKDTDAHVATALRDWRGTIRWRLVAVVYGVPVAIVALLASLIHFR